MDGSNTFPLPPMDTPRRPRGRPPTRSWAFFTTIVEPQKQPSAVCRHCNQLVHHRQKWGQARTHLMKCSQFLRLMDTIPANEVPDWYLAEISRRQHGLIRNKTAAIYNVPVFQNQVPTQPTSPFKMIQPNSMVTAEMMTSSKENGEKLALNNTNKVDLDQMEENAAMHLFTTISMEKLVDGQIEFPFLFQALETCAPDFNPFSKEKLLTKLLNRCVESVKRRVEEFFKSGSVPITLSLDRVTPGSVCYMARLASLQKYPIYLESVKVRTNSEERFDVEWGAADIARVVKAVSCPVAGCVLPCSSPEMQQTRKLLEKRFPTMYFHGCMRDALSSIIRHIFTATEKKCTILAQFAHDIQQFALQCKDLVFYLPPQKRQSFLHEASSCGTTLMHVTVVRRLTIEEAFYAILQAEAFLDADNVLDQLFSARPDDSIHGANTSHLQTQLVKIVRSPQFEENLRKFLEVLRPLHLLLESLADDNDDATSLLLSEVYSTFLRLAQQYASSTVLQEEEKEAVQALVQQQQEIMLGSAHLLGYLLDPVLLGEAFPVDMTVEVEQKMLGTDCTSRLTADQEALYTQYMDFKSFALNQKVNKAETLAFRELKERKKSPLQFWFADGARWPLLQAFACRVFVMPVCVANAARVVSKAGGTFRHLDEQVDFFTSDKLAYVRVNTHQLDLAEADESSLVSLPQKFQLDNFPKDITASMVV